VAVTTWRDNNWRDNKQNAQFDSGGLCRASLMG
jgi:hypothetical protein